MNTLFTFISGDDLYEISLKGFIIVRITRYWNGSSHRQDLDYDDCCESVKDCILKEVEKILHENH